MTSGIVSLYGFNGEPLPPIGSGNQGDPNASGNPGELTLSAYSYGLNTLSAADDCLSGVIAQYQNSSIDMVEGDGMLMCAIGANNSFNISDEGLLVMMKDQCGTESDCMTALADCFSRLEEFQHSYEISLNGAILEAVFSEANPSICQLDDQDFDQEVRNDVFEVYTNEDALFAYLFTVNEDLSNLNEEFSTAPVWLWPILQEIGAEMIIRIIEKQLKLTLADDIKDLIRAIGQQDLASFVKEAINIVAQFHPTVRLLDAIWDTTTLAKKAYSVIGKIKGMATSLGNETLVKIWNAMNARGRSVLDNFDVSGGSFGLRFNNTSIDELWDDLIGSFDVTPSISADGSGVQFRFVPKKRLSRWDSINLLCHYYRFVLFI